MRWWWLLLVAGVPAGAGVPEGNECIRMKFVLAGMGGALGGRGPRAGEGREYRVKLVPEGKR